ncbi:YgjV family protein [Vibrio metschnikovii]|uniref:YgjV family protein n=2 Tax=Bacteria TaxID=2 RepID=A0A9X0R6G0_VIBME|nr:YgjV family protein [Vibrio metschnikovii]EKO3587846.1 YgjV family protein [Vibrio metschnikovii]EKO3717074.1 YgjV family protein [Vibrio metschnikovii]EKO3734502.1 YgjV family protein [Vibrio metschnikovii]EKO3745151.1 YgjV family protein [Vibrio metschnikovii]MBC5850419.1 YgjV family protein [Vibrio metschnikovii]
MMVDLSLAQALGLVSFGLGISTFYQKDDRRLKIIMLIFNLNHLLHFFLLGSMVSAFSAALSALRTGSSIYTSSKYVAMLFLIAGGVLGISIAEHWWDLWPVIGTMIGTFAIFMLRGVSMRIAFLIGACCWLTNNILIGSIGGTLLEMTVIIVNSVTIYRLLRDQKRIIATQTL